MNAFIKTIAKRIFDWYNGIWIDGKIHATSVVHDCIIDNNVKIGKHSYCYNTNIGSYSYLAGFNIVSNTKIGKFCSIGSFVSIAPGTHPTHTFVSTSPAFFSKHKQCGESFAGAFYFKDTSNVNIGNDVWIGNNVVVLDGLTIGDGAIIAAGSIVNRDVLPYTIVGGVPAKFIKLRFSGEIIEKLMDSKWWEKDDSWFRENLHSMHDINIFLEKMSDN